MIKLTLIVFQYRELMMKGMSLAFCLLAFCYISSAQSARKLHNRSVVIDTHNDILTAAVDDGHQIDRDLSGKTHSDLARFRKGGVDIQIFSVWCDGSFLNEAAFARANREIDTLYAVADRNRSAMMIVHTPGDLRKAVRMKKLGAMIGVEGGHMIADRLDYLDSLFNRGTRYLTLTWNNSTSWATSAMDETAMATHDSLRNKRKGLTDFGKQVIKRMNELGMIVDVSHVGEATFWDAINTSTKPVIASHSCVHSLCPVFRNLKDEQIRAIAKSGGVIHLNFYSGFVDSMFFRRINDFNARHKAERDSLLALNPEPYFADSKLSAKYPGEVAGLRPPMSLLLDHLDYIVKLVGTDHVGLGSDFDGISSAPQHLDDVTSFPLLTEALLKRGYSKKDVRKILGGNFIRVFEANTNPATAKDQNRSN